MLPFLKPALASAAVLAFLASFENYNTTVFTIVSESTLTTFLAAKVRHGINPSISALAVVIVVLTLLGAALHEAFKRRELAAEREAAKIAKGEQEKRKAQVRSIFDPAVVIILLVFVAGLGTAYFAGTIGLNECKAEVRAEKMRITQERVRKRQQKTMFQEAGRQAVAPIPPEEAARGRPAPGTSNFQGLFSPENLEQQAGTGQQEPAQRERAAGTEQYQGIFAPQNLEDQVGGEQEKQQE